VCTARGVTTPGSTLSPFDQESFMRREDFEAVVTVLEAESREAVDQLVTKALGTSFTAMPSAKVAELAAHVAMGNRCVAYLEAHCEETSQLISDRINAALRRLKNRGAPTVDEVTKVLMHELRYPPIPLVFAGEVEVVLPFGVVRAQWDSKGQVRVQANINGERGGVEVST
jgi:hypothetical protein